MKILIISNYYPPYFVGGYELGCKNAVQALEEMGHDIQVLTSTYGVDKEIIDGKVHRLLQLSYEQLPSLVTVLRKEKINQQYFRKLCMKFEPDVVFCWNMANISMSLIYIANDMHIPVSYYVFDNWLASCEMDQWFQHCKSFSPTCNFLLHTFRPSLKLLPSEKPIGMHRAIFASYYLKSVACRAEKADDQSEVLHWGVLPNFEVSYFSKMQIPQRLLYVGQLVEHKGIHTVVEALGILNAAYGNSSLILTIVGDFEQNPLYIRKLKELIDKYDISHQIHFVGKVQPDGLAHYFTTHGILVFPSVWDEPFGISQLEAMSYGMAVVGTATGGSSEILIDNVNSLVFLRDNPDDCADKILCLLEDERIYRSVCQGGVESVNLDFNFKKVLVRMNQLLMETVREEQREHVVPPTDIAIERNETSRFLLIEFYVVMHKILSLIILLAVVVWNLISARLSTRRINRNYSSEPGCVLFIALGDSIDLVLSAPIIESFRSKFPECKIRIVVRSNLVNFIKGNPFFDAVIPFEFCAVHNWQRMTRGHAQWWYNAFAIPHSLLESISTVITLGWKRDAVHAASAAVMHRVGILNIIGFRDDGTGVVQRILNFFIDHGPLRSSVRNDKDAINILLQDLNLLDRDPVACVRKCFFSVQSMPRVNEFLRTVSGTVVALAPGGETELQCWPLDYYVELGNWIIKEYGASIIILGELSDRIRCQDLYLRLDGDQKAVFAGELRLHEIFEIMPLLSLVCGNENIFYHTSVFSGTPSVSMFGPGVFNCMDSATRKHQVVRQGLSCSPCSNNCLFNKPICMEGISVESVKRAVSYSLDRSSILSINTS